MAIQPLIKNSKVTGQGSTAAMSISPGTKSTKFWCNIDDVTTGSGLQRAYVEHSADGTNWTILTTINVYAPEVNGGGRGMGYFDGLYHQTEGFFRLRYDFPGLVTLDASYEVSSSLQGESGVS